MTKLYPLLAIFTLPLAPPSWTSDLEPVQKKQKAFEELSDWDLIPDNCKLQILSHLTPDVRAVTRRVCQDFRYRVDYMEAMPSWLNQIHDMKTFFTRFSAIIHAPHDKITIQSLVIQYPSLGALCINTHERPFINREIAIISFVHRRITPLTYGDEVTAEIAYSINTAEDPENQEPGMIADEGLNPQPLTFSSRIVHNLLQPGLVPHKICLSLNVDPGKRARNGVQPVPKLLGTIDHQYDHPHE